MNVSGQWIRLKSAVDVRVRPKSFRVFLRAGCRGVTLSLGIHPRWIKSLLIFQEAHSPIPNRVPSLSPSFSPCFFSFFSPFFLVLFASFPPLFFTLASTSLGEFRRRRVFRRRRQETTYVVSLRLSLRILRSRPTSLLRPEPRRPSKQTAAGSFFRATVSRPGAAIEKISPLEIFRRSSSSSPSSRSIARTRTNPTKFCQTKNFWKLHFSEFFISSLQRLEIERYRLETSTSENF